MRKLLNVSKLSDRLIQGAKEALVVTKCDHDLIELPRKRPMALRKWWCRKCAAVIYEAYED